MNAPRRSCAGESPSLPDMLRAYLASRDEPCPGCGYNLRDLTGERCPECNQPLTLRVGLAEPHLGAYLAALSGPLAAAGTAAVILSIIAYATLRFGPPPRQEMVAIVGIPALGLVCHSGLLALLLRTRGRAWFRSAGTNVRIAIIVVGWALPLLFIAWFFCIVP